MNFSYDLRRWQMLLASSESFSVSHATVLIILFLVLLLLNAIMAGAETAYFSLSSKDVNQLKKTDQSGARQVVHLLEQPKVLRATILVSNIFFKIALIITALILLRHYLPAKLPTYLSFPLIVLVISFLLLLFGEILPKVYASQTNTRMAIFAAPVVHFFSGLFNPIIKTMIASFSFFEDRAKPVLGADMTEENFEEAIELTLGHKASREEVNIFKSIIKFSHVTVRQVMTPRLDVTGIPLEANFDQLREIALSSGFSRMPVYKENLDEVHGMIHSRDLLPYYQESLSFDWHSLMRPLFFVPEGKYIEDLLKEFQQKQIHFALVADEFGGTSGIITMEDIVEEIIGEIRDEFDEEELHYKKIDDFNYIFEGKTLINDACRIIGVPVETFEKARGESDSIAGLVLEIAGKFPMVNETIRFDQFEFTILEMNKLRLETLKISLLSRTSEAKNREL